MTPVFLAPASASPTDSGSTARDRGLVGGEQLFPSETVLWENVAESRSGVDRAVEQVEGSVTDTALAIK